MQTIGERLEEARKKKGISIREAAEATKVRGEYLQKFESNQFDIGLSDLYVRGFLRSYALFLKLAPDRILTDFAALGHGTARPRQPSREVYGRMDLSIGSAGEGGDGAAPEPEAAGPAAAPGQPQAEGMPRQMLPLRRNSGGMQLQAGINQALVFKGLIALGCILVLLLILWGVKSIMGGSPAPAEPARSAAVTSAPVQQEHDATVTISALDAIRIKVVRQSDGAELYQGPLARGEQRDFENVPLYLTSTALESVVIEYKGKRYGTGHKGHDRVAFDFSSR